MIGDNLVMGPGLDGFNEIDHIFILELDHSATILAHQMVMTTKMQGFIYLCPRTHIRNRDLSGMGQPFQRTVDGGWVGGRQPLVDMLIDLLRG